MSEGCVVGKRKFGSVHDRDSALGTEKKQKIEEECTPTTKVFASEFKNTDYVVGWICAITTEYVAAQAFLDEKHEGPDYVSPNDDNIYTLGRMGKHNIVIAVLPDGEYGTSSAARVGRDLQHTFPNVRIGLLVGIGGGAPTKHDIRLGDIVVSAPREGKGGIFQYDFGKTIQNQSFCTTGFLNQPPVLLRAAMNDLKAQYEFDGHGIDEAIKVILDKRPRLKKRYEKPDLSSDRLYCSGVIHPPDHDAACTEVCSNDSNHLIVRNDRPEDEMLVVHYGLIASSNQLLKDASIRDKLAREKNVLCFEMEAAGLVNHFPCLVIRGICDYADSHKNKRWQGYAAMTAAAYAKDLLSRIPPNKIEAQRRIVEVLLDLKDDVKNVSKGIDKILHKQHSVEEKDIFQWITPIDYTPQQHDFLKRRQPGTGQWLLECTEFQDWLKNSKRGLFCPGIPGSGKTIITAIVIDHLSTSFQGQSGIGLAFIFCNFRRHHEQTLEDLLATLLKQLTQQKSPIPNSVRDLYESCKNKGGRPSVEKLSTALQFVSGLFTRTFVIIDALDECQTTSGCRNAFLDELLSLQLRCGTNLLMTSRFIPEIAGSLGSQTTLEIRPSDNDVRRYLDGRMSQLPGFIRHDRAFQDYIKDGIVRAVNGMFLLAHLYMDSLDDKMTKKAVEKAIRHFQDQNPGPNEEKKIDVLSQAYAEAVERIRAQKPGIRQLAEKTLLWITCAKRPLTTSELQHALAVELESEELDENNSSAVDDMVSSCAGLVIIDEESKIIRLVHYTMQDYFTRNQKKLFSHAEETVASVCVQYLLFNYFKSGPCTEYHDLELRLKHYSLYDYAARNWGHHARVSSPPPRKLLLKLLYNESKLMASNQARMASKLPGGGVGYTKMSAAHIIAFFGLSDLITAVGERYSLKAQTSDGQTPLSVAAENGHEAVVRWLMQQEGVDLNTRAFRYLWTPLSLAARNGHYETCRLLLAQDGVDPDPRDSGGRTPLSWAAGNGHEDVVGLFLSDCRVSPDSRASWFYKGRTPVMWAAANGHIGIVKLLLGTGMVDYGSNDDDGRTILSYAAQHGSSELIKEALARKGIKANRADQTGRTALSWAAQNGQTANVKLLLARNDVDPNSTDNSNRTALSWAAQYGHAPIVRLLVFTNRVYPNLKDNNGITPLSWALRCNQSEIQNFLLGTEGVDASSDYEDSHGLPSLPTDYKQHDVSKMLPKNKYSNSHASIETESQKLYIRRLENSHLRDEFIINKTIGLGSCSRVYLAQLRSDKRALFAIKVLKKAHILKTMQIRHTVNQRAILIDVSHPFLAELYGTFQDMRRLYMVMEFVEGGELFTLLRQVKRFRTVVAKFYSAQIVLAVDYLHSKDIIHRDLKPENVLVDWLGYIKVVDFGFAKRVPAKTWTLCGTPEYMAPEVISGRGYGKSVDWWCLGILTYEMLCGYTPFANESPLLMYENILKGEVKYPSYLKKSGAQDLLENLITSDLERRLGTERSPILTRRRPTLTRRVSMPTERPSTKIQDHPLQTRQGGSWDIRSHPWFQEVDWNMLERKQLIAPYRPPIKPAEGYTGQKELLPRSDIDTQSHLLPILKVRNHISTRKKALLQKV
ncbi:AGC/PKA protein kinase [Fusarium verticillioides 7600]|uniref:cAMP-dependent protein kinase n=1 Tax=Gibberella moniliformis (strain M3125 / FGSC 7600) TaxID=334819 RepID=W7MER6_GIBM7|nr:AGC/PKA protein kinase [Fusarium verticillioides 7600]EWG50058.1 AGC/PKA protein kinase [Fusarium verticillioides 7600]